MEAVSEVLLRNHRELGSGPLYLVNPAPDHLATELAGHFDDIRVFTQDFGHAAWFEQLGIACEFGVFPKVPDQTETLVLRLAREKDRFEMLLHALADSMPSGTRLWIVGEKRAGIQSASKRINRFFKSVNKRDSARHCVLLEASEPRDIAPFSTEGSFSTWPAEYAGRTLQIASLPGVFAHGRLDRGTELLLQATEHLVISGKVLDFACGAGVIGTCLKVNNPGIELSSLDVSAAALAAAAKTHEINDIKGKIIASDGLSCVSEKYDWIATNPPFHQGVRDDLDVAAVFFRLAGTFLTEKGKILVVFNRHLPYMGWIKENFDHVETLVRNREFCVVKATGK